MSGLPQICLPARSCDGHGGSFGVPVICTLGSRSSADHGEFTSSFGDWIPVRAVTACGSWTASRANHCRDERDDVPWSCRPAPSGARLRARRPVDIGRVENGQAKGRWGGLNMYSLLTQLGAVPAPQAS